MSSSDGAIQLEARDRVSVFGKTGMGKSHWVKFALIASLLRRGVRVLAFDVCDEHSQHGRATKEIKLGLLRDRVTVDELVLDPKRYLDRADLSLAVVPDGEPEEVAAQFEDVAVLVKHTGNLCLVIDEVGYFQLHCQGKLSEAATLYRKWGVSVVFIAQRQPQIPLTARTQSSHVVSFRQDKAGDLRDLAEDTSQEFADQVGALHEREFRHWRDTDKVPAVQPTTQEK